MEDNFLFLNSLGGYTDGMDNTVKLPSGAERGAFLPQKSQRDRKSEKTKSGFPVYTSDDSHLKIVVKNEPEEDSWDPELNTDPDLLPDDSSQSQHGAERQRNIRFSDEENDVLIRSVMPHYEKLFGRLAARHSTVAKNALWREITAAVNAVSACPRSVQNCKKRFADIKRKVKEKLSRIDKHRQTSGGATRLHISFWPYERVMEKIIATDVVPDVPGTTDSGRVTEHESSDFHDLGEEDEAGNTEGEDCQTSVHNDDQEEFPEEADAEIEGRTALEEPAQDGRPSLKQEQVNSRRHQTLRDHTSLIYAEQSLFRRTMAQKFNLLNNNVRVLTKNVRTFQRSFSRNMAALAQSMQQQNAILDKLSSNLLLLAEQQQQHNKQCMNGMQQVLHHLDVHQVSPSPTPSDSASDSSPLPMEARRGAHWRRVRRRSKSQISPEHTPKKGRH